MKLEQYERDYVVEQYEALRREALEAAPFAPRGPGMAVFEMRGMLGWLTVLTALALPAAPKLPQQAGPQLAGTLRSELTLMLSSMVLSLTQTRRDSDAQRP
jgi:hypothetical protein